MVVMIALAPTICFSASFGKKDKEIGFAGVDICKPGIIDVPQVLKDSPPGDQSELPTGIEADEIKVNTDNAMVLTGNAQVIQGNRGVYADVITYDPETYHATASGGVIFYTSKGDEILADSLAIFRMVDHLDL